MNGKRLMDGAIFLPVDDELGAIKLKGRWRFFYGGDWMFLLDYPSYDDGYIPKPGEFRYGTLIVDESNAEQWMMKDFDGELTLEQFKQLSRVGEKLRFVIDFDNHIWIGRGYYMDQSALEDYQPKEWLAMAEDVYEYLPPEIRNYLA